MRFATASGSTYEIDKSAKRIRRLAGMSDPQPRQGADGEWKVYEGISSVVVGEPVAIFWPVGTPLLEGSPAGAMPATITSRVVSVS